MFLIIANGVQLCGAAIDIDAAKQSYEDYTAAHPETVFTVFEQVYPPLAGESSEGFPPIADTSIPEAPQGAVATHGEGAGG